ncbi:hypothetical protein PI124_g11595 [Phytophthora idaei]|nr:hypothetical protein PI125_g3472 [Phytophthora idaei]KAG3167812.1 hypothetical protein PI126_g3642 [Phytophthora idaei]KAG3243587.1 hypothetical protein PI124_g11595 [Phytophthora idaei]
MSCLLIGQAVALMTLLLAYFRPSCWLRCTNTPPDHNTRSSRAF